MMQHRGGRASDTGGYSLRRAGGHGGATSAAGDRPDRSTIGDRQFLTHDGVSGRTVAERARNADRSRLERGLTAAREYRNGGNQGFGDMDLEEIERDVEDQIQIAVANGEFNNLEGTGKPLTRLLNADNPYLDSSDRLGFAILQKHGFAPEWIEQQKKLNHDLDK